MSSKSRYPRQAAIRRPMPMHTQRPSEAAEQAAYIALEEMAIAEDEAPEIEDEALEEYTAQDYLAGHLLPLPSGKAIRVKPVSLLSMLRVGSVPNALIGIAKKLIYGEDARAQRIQQFKQRQGMDQKGLTPSEGEDSSKLMDFLVIELVSSFTVVDKPAEECAPGEVPVSRMYDADKLAIMQFALKGQTALSSFRR